MKSLQSLSYKTLFIIFFFSLAGIIFFLKIGGKTTKVSAVWWDDNWHYRKSISTNNTGDIQSNVYLTISIDTSDSTKFQTDCGDIRFTNQDGSLLNYYIVSGCGTATTSVHINFPTLISGASNFYLYYGNTSADNGFSVSDFATAASSSSPSLQSEEVGGGPVAYWKFDEGSGTTVYDSSENKNNGILMGSTLPTWTEGKSNSGIGFSGVNDYISIPYKPNFREAVTVSIWMKRTTAYNQLTDIMLLSSPNAWFFYDSYNSGNVHGDVYIDGVRKGAINVPVPFDGNWYQITYTYDSATHFAKMYKNGVLYQSVGITGLSNYLIDQATGNLYSLGKNSLGRGIILDEPKIYNYARTADQIKLDYNSRGSLSGSSANLGVQSSNKITGSAIQFGSTTQNIGGTTTSLDYCIPGDTNYCAPPVAEWKMDEGIGTSIVDTSGNNKNGVFNNSPTWGQGKIGQAVNFNPTNNSSITTTFNSQLTKYTVEAWIKANSFGTGINNTIMAASNHYPLWFTLTNGEIRAFAFSNSTSIYGETTGANITLNKWYHIAVSATQNGTATIYVNGVGLTSFPAQNDSWPSNSVITIGDLRINRNLNFNGAIDQAKIYDYIRTPAQIAYDYNKGGPVGWWKMDECQGSAIYDWSGNGNNGTLTIGSNGTQNSIGTCQIGTSAAWTNGASGKINSSLNFDGTDDYISIPDNPLLRFNNNDFCITAWVKHSSNLNSIHRGIYTKGGISSGGFSLYIEGFEGGKLRFINENSTTFDSTKIVADNNWHHIVTCRNNNNLIFYIDGIFDNLNTNYFNGITLNSSANILIGLRDSNRYFTGQLDDVRVYNYTLTSEQVKQVYNNGAINFQ